MLFTEAICPLNKTKLQTQKSLIFSPNSRKCGHPLELIGTPRSDNKYLFFEAICPWCKARYSFKMELPSKETYSGIKLAKNELEHHICENILRR